MIIAVIMHNDIIVTVSSLDLLVSKNTWVVKYTVCIIHFKVLNDTIYI